MLDLESWTGGVNIILASPFFYAFLSLIKSIHLLKRCRSPYIRSKSILHHPYTFQIYGYNDDKPLHKLHEIPPLYYWYVKLLSGILARLSSYLIKP